MSCQDSSPVEDLHPSQDNTSLSALQTSQVGISSVRFWASWNVRTMLDVDGPIETARQGNELDIMDAVDEWKVDQVVAELVSTEWMWLVYKRLNGLVVMCIEFVTARPCLVLGQLVRGEGVAIVLSGHVRW